MRTWLEIDLARLRANLRAIRAHVPPGVEIMPAVKANAYGHGAVAVSQALAAAGEGVAPEHFAVATPAEARELRQAGIEQPIHLIGALLDSDISAAIAANAVVTVHHRDQVPKLNEQAAGAGTVLAVHVNVDTGMGRLGCQPGELPGLVDALIAAPSLAFDGVWSHFATAERAGCPETARQIAALRSAVEALRRRGTPPRLAHIANSAGLAIQQVAGFSPVRPGIVLYGLYPGPDVEPALDVQPVLSWKSRIILLKDLLAGTTVGYGRTYRLARPGRIGTVPVGYADGYSRLVGGKAEVLVRGRRVPVVGTVSMDYLTVLLDEVEGAQVGDEVVLIGRQGGEEISAGEFARWMGTIHYEVTCRIGNRVERVYRDQP